MCLPVCKMANSLSLQNILNYAEITPNSRNLIEAERLLKSEFVITFGATKITENSLDILALCLKTSGMKEAPHTIKAGAAVCKHKTAVLLLCYQGLQKCKEFPSETVQGIIEDALLTLCPANDPLTTFASRTDKGVHALMNTFHVDLEHKRQGEVYQPYFIRKFINSYLRENNHEIMITHASVVPESFHARFHVKWRSYLYRLAILRPELKVTYPECRTCQDYLPINLLNRCHAVPSSLNINVVRDAMNLYHGSHDFSAFSKFVLRDSWKSTKRIIEEIKFYELSPFNHYNDPMHANITMWEFYIKSSSFLYHQVRKLVGTAIAAGFGLISLSDIEALLKYPTPDKFYKTHLAPACGLYLSNLHYDKEAFAFKEDFDLLKESSLDS